MSSRLAPGTTAVVSREGGPSDEQLRKLGSALYEAMLKMSARDARDLAHVIYEFSLQDLPEDATIPLYILAEMAEARSKVR